MKDTFLMLVLGLLTVALGGCAAMGEVQTEPVPDTTAVGGQVEEIMPGMLQGYPAMEAARADIDRLRSKGMAPGTDCAAKAAALAQMR
jgi:hypothetical protein